MKCPKTAKKLHYMHLVYIKITLMSCIPCAIFFRVVFMCIKLKYTFKTDKLSRFLRGEDIM